MSVFTNSKTLLIDSRISALIKGRQFSESDVPNSAYFHDNYVYNWDAIQQLFGSNFFRDDIYPKLTYENCLEYVDIIRSMWKDSSNVCKNLLKNNKVLFYENLKWFGNVEILHKFLESPKSPTYVIEGCLLFTAVLENSLGNLYYTIAKKSPPHLLKDLLSTSELKNLFSPFPIFFLKLLLGTPNSVNLRNIVWHGFPAPGDLPEYYLPVLIVVINTLSVFMREKSFLISPRDKITCHATYLNDEVFKFCDLKNDFIVHQIFNNSKYILKSHSAYWEQIYKYFQSKKYEQFTILILPQIELVLRLIYADCNQVDVGAKIDEYYIIIDTIFEDKVINKENMENKIFSHLDHGTLKLLYDLFISQNGPCIRDKVSHGEINFNALDESICSILFFVSLNLLEDSKNKVYNLSSYESKFHINSVVFKKIVYLKTHIKMLREMEIPQELENCVDWNLKSPIIIFKVNNFRKIKIFLRPKQENELVGYLSKILDCIELSCDNLLYSFRTHFESFNKKQLRSPRRKTLEKLLLSLPFMYTTFEVMIKVIEEIFCALQQAEKDFNEEYYKKCVKFLKHFLKCVENMAKYCQHNKNEWEKSTKICHTFYEGVENFRKDIV